MKCRFSGKDIPKIIDFGEMPLGNGFLSEKISDEYFFNMSVAVNFDIGLIQLIDQPDPKKMFHQDYAFFTRTSNFMIKHFNEVADEIYSILDDRFINDKSKFVVEIGSNDGVMLENLVNKDINCLGIEPSKNVAKVSNRYGVKTLNDFFSLDISNEVLSNYQAANIIYAANVFCHIPDINDLAKACANLLKDGGLLLFEDPYLGDVLQKTSYDQIYDEHVYLFSCHSVQSIFGKYGLRLIDCKPLKTHGGSMRYYLVKDNKSSITENLKFQLDSEVSIGLLSLSTYEDFAQRCEFSKIEFKRIIEEYKYQNMKVVGYGATSKSTTILNYCDVGPELIDFIVDTTPIKQGKLTPGKHIPVKDYSNFLPHPDISVLFAWNHKKEIMDKEIDYKGKWITHLYDDLKK